MSNYYISNKETNKVELHFEKELYTSLSDSDKAAIKSACLFSRRASAWVSRGYIGSYSAIKAAQIAEKIGLENHGATGERLSFAEQMERKAERAENRAERYETYAANATTRGNALQKPINDMHGDIAFFTQPNISSSAGRAFTRKRDRMFSAWERGFEEFKKSDYFKERAETARQTANGCKRQSIAFCQRRIDECNHNIKALGKNLETYKKYAERINNGETIKRYSGEVLTAETVDNWIDETADRIDAAIDKAAYYQAMIDAQGGQKYNKDNISLGDVVNVGRFGRVEVVRKGTKNFVGKLATGGTLSFAFAEIIGIFEKQDGEREIKHGFKVGDKYNVKMWDETTSEYKTGIVEITKVTPDKVTVKINGGRAKSVTVRNGYNNDYYIPIAVSRWNSEWIHPKKEGVETC